MLHRIATLAIIAAIGLLTQILFSFNAEADSTSRPNVVLILADDLGYGDLGCYGHPVAKTPNIDRLARQGVRFTQHYSNGPECSPTRTALMTGRYQQRVGGLECAIGTGNVGRYDDAIRLAEQHDLGLPVEKAVLPRVLVAADYQCGVFGKWHLGYEPKFNPMRYRWHEFFGYLGGNVHYFDHHETSDLHVLFAGTEPVQREGYMTHLITDHSIDFIKRHRDQPFFVYVSHECPHFPYQGPGDKGKRVTAENWMELDEPTYIAMLQDLDTEVGRILQTLQSESIADNTLVIFVSDNGGFAGAGNMGPLQGSKGTTLEGGIRVPMVMRWPGKIRPGTVCEQPCVSFDLTRSILALAGADVSGMELEGIDIVSHVVEDQPDFERTLFWRGRRGKRTWVAVRDGDLKLVEKREADVTQRWLYDLADDIDESDDLAESRPADFARLRGLVRDWEADVKADR